jgi:large subunit ribosomal protein L15
MVVRKRKKSRRLRCRTRTMSWGRIGQHRKSGSKGGFGAAGMHKHMWTWVVKYAPRWFGKHGFTRPERIAGKKAAINVGVLDELASYMEKTGMALIEDGRIVIDAQAMGFNKVLGSGRVTRPLKVITREASEAAKKKIEEAGGLVVVQQES